MTGFLGSYRHQLDGKGRLALPASFRRSVSEEGFVLIHFQEPSLFLYPATSWVDVEGRLLELVRRQSESRKAVLALTANALEVVPDKQGRILVPERLQKAAKLDGEALIVGVLDRIEIWNPELFESTTREVPTDSTQFVRQLL